MDILIEALSAIDFDELDVDELLDNRDSKVFDTEWVRVYKAIESLKNEGNYTAEEVQANSSIRETVFMKIYGLSKDGDLAAYISDDFGLISDAELLGYEDGWLDKLIACYRKKIIPQGRL